MHHHVVITLHFKLCSTYYSAFKSTNSKRSISANNLISTENTHHKHSHRETTTHSNQLTCQWKEIKHNGGQLVIYIVLTVVYQKRRKRLGGGPFGLLSPAKKIILVGLKTAKELIECLYTLLEQSKCVLKKSLKTKKYFGKWGEGKGHTQTPATILWSAPITQNFLHYYHNILLYWQFPWCTYATNYIYN